MKHKCLPAIILACLMILALASGALAEEIHTVAVAGVNLTAGGTLSVGGGTVTYDAAAKTLTLDNVTLDTAGSDTAVVNISNVDLQIVIKGTNKIVVPANRNYGLRAVSATTKITGGGTLDVSFAAPSYFDSVRGIHALRLEAENVTLKIRTPNSTGSNAGILAPYLTMRNCVVDTSTGESVNYSSKAF